MDPVSPPSPGPSRGTRALAFLAIVVAGACGGLIGYAITDLQCKGRCDTAVGLGGMVGALVGAGGVAVIAVLVLRAMGEWHAGPGRPDVWPPPDAGPGPGPAPGSGEL